MKSSLIFDIKRFAINDGPGIRLTVFFKGCPLSCQWCHNPESISSKVEKMYTASKCIGSLKCIEVCPNTALSLSKEGIITNHDLCKLCGLCASNCPSKAFEMLGSNISIDALMKKIDAEAIFFDQSEGGVSFSGGEPLMHSEYLLEALKACGKRMYHRVVDTSAYAQKEILLEVAKHTELFLVDLKVMDNDKHQRYTGVSNQLILDNILALSKTDCKIIFRIPLIRNLNDTPENIEQTAQFINTLNGQGYQVQLLPYHNIAENKYQKLAYQSYSSDFQAPDTQTIENIIHQFKNHNIEAILGG